MLSENSHLSDQELLLAADGELATRRLAQIRVHLAACWDCRARMAEIEGTIADFARAHHQAFDAKLPPVDGPRALLRAQLAELTAKTDTGSWPRFLRFTMDPRVAASICVAFLVAMLGGENFVQRYRMRGTNLTITPVERVSVPNRSLTPGATRRVAVRDVCSMPHEQVVRDVPTSLRQEVFQEYGIVNARKDDYEIDFLIAPGLGGVEDIHNLWPEPYTSATWNAHVKDALEEQLHQLVCDGKLDLSTAQSDIASNWIAAYKKYFHTDRPLSARI